MLAPLLALLLQGALPNDSLLAGAREPAYAPDGRLAVSVDGDLYVQRTTVGAGFARITSGAAWDREPAWAPDGSALVFASNRAGGFDLWRVRVSRDGVTGEPERLTTHADPDGEPAVASDGRVLFVRGRGASARLWVRGADGAEKRVTAGRTAERSPALSADGARVAYVAVTDQGGRLRVRALDAAASATDSLVVGDRSVEHPAWSPAGDRLAFTVRGARPGVFVAAADGRWVNLVSARWAEIAWSPDGGRLALAELSGDAPGYNGDPERIADRDAAERLSARGRLLLVDAPAAPDAGLAEQRVAAARPRAERNAEAFDRAWERVRDVYLVAPDAAARRASWERARASLRARAVAAPNDSALEEAIHALLRARPPLREAATGRAAVSSAHPVATAAGVEVLRRGGNVVDAAVAVSFALGVVEPDASGVGGYGQMLVLLKGMERPVLIDFMSRVPEGAGLDNATLAPGGRYPEDGPVLANVPGTVAGMFSAWRRFGSRAVPWSELLAPAIRAAKDGVPVSDGLATTLRLERDHFAKWEGSRALFFREGEPLHAGDTLKNPGLAFVLERIARDSADGFYKGEVARRIVADLRAGGNAIRASDLARYYAAEREPVSGTFRGHTVFSSAPPVSGGATLVAQLNLLEQAPAPKPWPEDAPTLHAMISAWQLVPSSRGRIADPGLWPVNTQPFTSKDTALVRWRCFDPAKALTPAMFRGDTLTCARDRRTASTAGEGLPAREGCERHEHAPVATCRAMGTTAFVVADAEGNVVAVTQTLGTWGGTFHVTPGLGFLYNDKLTSYGTEPESYGARLPFARHGSTLAPTIVTRGEGAARRAVLAVGAAGNAWITSAVYQTLVGVIDQGLGVQQALEAPRFLPSGRGAGSTREYVVDIEAGVAPSVMRRLEAMGHRFNVISLPGEVRMGYAAAIQVGPREVTAGADPRRSGAAGAVK